MIFRSGKYQGYSVDEVRRMAPWYIRWVQENRPEMLKERPQKKKVTQVTEDEEFTKTPKVNVFASWGDAF